MPGGVGPVSKTMATACSQTDRTITSAAGSLTDTFEPMAVHIYRMDGYR